MVWNLLAGVEDVLGRWWWYDDPPPAEVGVFVFDLLGLDGGLNSGRGGLWSVLVESLLLPPPLSYIRALHYF